MVAFLLTRFYFTRGNKGREISVTPDGLDRREGHPGRVQQEKLMFPLWTCDTCYNPIFYEEYNAMKIFLS